VETWIAPRAREIGARIAGLEDVRRVIRLDAVRAAFETPGSPARWPLLFFAVWRLIHFQDAAPVDALAAVVGSL
jgi:asparagine synthase (glutamine-hydrolysing)